MGRAESHKPHRKAGGDEKLPLDSLRGRWRGTWEVAWQQLVTSLPRPPVLGESVGGAGGVLLRLGSAEV